MYQRNGALRLKITEIQSVAHALGIFEDMAGMNASQATEMVSAKQRRKKMIKLPFATLEDVKEGKVLVFDKPMTWTSFDVVNKVRVTIKHTFGIKKIKVGHAGTLDPLATGVLIICTGKKTKTIESLQAEMKTYTGTIRLGATTPSFDAETEVDSWGDKQKIEELSFKSIDLKASAMVGDLDQMPPIFSAKKVDGKVAYKAARRGETLKLKTKRVSIFKFDIGNLEQKNIDDHEVVDVDFEIQCSKGTYIRAIARDLGKELGVGGTLVALHRTQSGDFKVENAYDLEEFIASVKLLASTED